MRVRRRILLLVTDLEIGGTPTVVRELAIRLKHLAHVEVACLKRAGPVAEQIRREGIEVTAFDAHAVSNLPGVIARLARLVRDRRIDTLFSFLLHANVAAAGALAVCSGVRGLQSIQTIQPNPAWHWMVQGLVAGRAESIVVPSNAIVQTACELSGIGRSKLIVVPNAIDPSAFEQAHVFVRNRVRAGYLGRLDPAKRPGLLIDMMQFTGDDVELHFYGEGPQRHRLASKAGDSPADCRIYFHGATDSPQQALSQLDLLLLPSAVEGFGLVLIEAMAAGVPVVACAAGGVLDVVRDGYNGLLIEPDKSETEAERYAQAISSLASDAAQRDRLIEAGLHTVRTRFNWTHVLPQYCKLLQIDAD